MPELSPTATRSRRHRARRQKGVVVAPIEVQPEVIDALVFCLFLEEADRHDRAAIGEAVNELLGLLAGGALILDETLLD